MIAFLKGAVSERRPDSIIIDVNGVGYEVNIHPFTAKRRAHTYPHLPAGTGKRVQTIWFSRSGRTQAL